MLLLWRESRCVDGGRAYGASAANAQNPGVLPLLHRDRRCTGWCGALMPLATPCGANAESSRGTPGRRARRAVWPRGRLAEVWPWELPLEAGVCSGAGRLGTRDGWVDLMIPRGAPASLQVPASRLPPWTALAFCVGPRVRTPAGCPSTCWSLDRLGWTRSRNPSAALVCTARDWCDWGVLAAARAELTGQTSPYE